MLWIFGCLCNRLRPPYPAQPNAVALTASGAIAQGRWAHIVDTCSTLARLSSHSHLSSALYGISVSHGSHFLHSLPLGLWLTDYLILPHAVVIRLFVEVMWHRIVVS